jgi:hypothetical protein
LRGRSFCKFLNPIPLIINRYYLAGAEDEEDNNDDDGGGGESDPHSHSERRRRATPPLIIWLTGGPGCSSLDAFTYEHGPFTFALDDGDDGDGAVELSRNPYAWAAAPAHVAYVDSPAGTGYSYAPGGADVSFFVVAYAIAIVFLVCG